MIKKKKKKEDDPTRTFVIQLKRDDINANIFRHMAKTSKNIYNTTIYISSLYYRYKKIIFDKAIYDLNYNIKDKKKFYERINHHFDYFYNLHSDKDNNINKNNSILFEYIKRKLEGKTFNNGNYDKFKYFIMKNCLGKVQRINEYDYEFIINKILKSFYVSKYNRVLYKLKNKMPIDRSDVDMIKYVKQGENLFPTNEIDYKVYLRFKKPSSDQSIITKFVYNKLGDNKDKLPADIIFNIIRKVFDNYKSYYALKQKGLKCSISKFLGKGDYYIIPFYDKMFKIKNDIVTLTVGKHVADNYGSITGTDNLICLKKGEKKNYYVDKNKLLTKQEDQKILKGGNYIIGDKYISKNDKNIIETNHVQFKLPEKLRDKKIKYIEVNRIDKSDCFKLCITYKIDKDEYIQQPIKIDECISIDLGVINLMTIYDPSGYQKIIKGKYLCSVNYFYSGKIDSLNSKISKEVNKELKEKLKIKRSQMYLDRINKINNFFNKVVKYMEEEYKHKKGIIIGYNLNWKKNVQMGRKGNRVFYGIPYRNLLNKIKDKFRSKVIMTEESYTSKCDSLTLEQIGRKEEYNGNRIKRGLYESKKGLINADLNGAINIMRKKIELPKIKGKKLFNPMVIKIITPKRIKDIL